MPLLNLHEATIAAGSAFSNVVPIGDDFIVGLIAPEDWTGAVVSLMVSVQGDNYFDMFDGRGDEFIFNVTAGTAMAADPNLLLCAAFVRLRSGTRDNPVVQESARRFYVIGTSKLARLTTEGTDGR